MTQALLGADDRHVHLIASQAVKECLFVGFGSFAKFGQFTQAVFVEQGDGERFEQIFNQAGDTGSEGAASAYDQNAKDVRRIKKRAKNKFVARREFGDKNGI